MRITAARAMKPSIPFPCRPLLLSLELPTVLFFVAAMLVLVGWSIPAVGAGGD